MLYPMVKILPYLCLFVVAPLSFGINMSSGPYAVDVLEPLSMVFFRWFGVVVIMLPFMIGVLWQSRQIIRDNFGLFVFASFLGMIICPAGVYISGHYTTAINIGLIYTLAPVFTIAMERIFFGKRLSIINGIGVMIAFVGVVYIIIKGDISNLIQLQFSVGDLWVLGAAFSWGWYSILLRKQEAIMAGKRLFTLNAVLGTLLALPLLMYEVHIENKPIVFSQQFFVLVAVISFISSIAAYMSMIYIIRTISVTTSSYVLYITPLYAALIGVFFLGETLHSYHIISAVVILSGVFLAVKKDRPQQGGSDTPPSEPVRS